MSLGDGNAGLHELPRQSLTGNTRRPERRNDLRACNEPVTALTALNSLASRIVGLIMLSWFFVFIVTAAAGPVVGVGAYAWVWIFDLAVNPRGNGEISISQGPHHVPFTADEWRIVAQAVTELLRDPYVPPCNGKEPSCAVLFHRQEPAPR